MLLFTYTRDFDVMFLYATLWCRQVSASDACRCSVFFRSECHLVDLTTVLSADAVLKELAKKRTLAFSFYAVSLFVLF